MLSIRVLTRRSRVRTVTKDKACTGYTYQDITPVQALRDLETYGVGAYWDDLVGGQKRYRGHTLYLGGYKVEAYQDPSTGFWVALNGTGESVKSLLNLLEGTHVQVRVTEERHPAYQRGAALQGPR